MHYNFYSKEEIEARLTREYASDVEFTANESDDFATVSHDGKTDAFSINEIATKVVGRKAYGLIDNGGLLIFDDSKSLDRYLRTH